MTISTILLVPADGDPHGLLADGVCGAKPPILDGWACNDAQHGLWWTFGRDLEPPICDVCSARKRWEEARALVLAYQGKPVPEGCSRVLASIAEGEPGIDRHGFPWSLVAFVSGGFGLTFGREGRLTWNARDVFGTTATFTTPTPVPVTDDGPPFALALAMVYVSNHPGARVVLLDADGREVTRG